MPDLIRHPETKKTLKLHWIPGQADCKKLSIYSQLQARNDKTAKYLYLPITTQPIGRERGNSSTGMS
jgi:hypothetical protein